MNKIISMNHSAFGDIASIEYTALELLDAERKVAQSMQKQTMPHIAEAGWVKEGDVFVALVEFANTDSAHILNAQQEVDWGEPSPYISGGEVTYYQPYKKATGGDDEIPF